MKKDLIPDKTGEKVLLIDVTEKHRLTNRIKEDGGHHRKTNREIPEKDRRQKQVLLRRVPVGKVQGKVNHGNLLDLKKEIKMSPALRILLLKVLKSTFIH